MHKNARGRVHGLFALTLALAAVATGPVMGLSFQPGVAMAATAPRLTIVRQSSPARSVVSDSAGWVATFTDGSQTVTLVGPKRTFSEASTPDKVVTSTWVRLLAKPFAGTVDQAWLTAARANRSPDILAIAFQYVVGASPVLNESGARIGGDASYGPLLADGTREEGSDFSDYLGMSWAYADGTIDAPETDQVGALDCSGFVRMVFGYRGGLALSLRPTVGALPRRAFEQFAGGPGTVVIANAGVAPSSRSKLAPGDLVFFDASTNDGTQIDHVGIFLGRDSAGHDRFLSSRKSADGPTMGDISGRSVLDGTGLYAKSFRAVRRA